MLQTNRAQSVFRRRPPAATPERIDGPLARRFAKRVSIRAERHQITHALSRVSA